MFGLGKNTFGETEAAAGEILGLSADGNRAIVKGAGLSLEFSSPLPGVLRLRAARGGEFPEDRSFAVIADRSGKSAPVLDEKPDRVEIELAGLKAVSARHPALFSFYGPDGAILFREHPLRPLALGEGASFGMMIEPGSRFFGFGEKTGPLDKRGRSMKMWNTDTPYMANSDPIYVSIPFTLISRAGKSFGLFFDNPAKAGFNVGATVPNLFSWSAAAGGIDIYIIVGPSPRDVVERFTALTGRMPLPPRWAFGHHQSRWSYETADEVRDIAKNFRERDIPGDVIHLDIHYMDRYRVFTFHPERFPDMKALAAETGEKGFKLVTIIDPGVAVAEDYPVYMEGRDRDLFCRDEKGKEYNARVWPGKVAFPDFLKTETRAWWGDLHKTLTDNGIAGIWNDMNEPSAWSADVRWRDYMLPVAPIRNPKMVHDDDGRETPHLSARNVYGLRECEATREGLRRLRPGVRPFVLTRAGCAGIQRCAAVWTGDNTSNFNHLKLSIPMLINLGLSGVAFCGPDIGGFKLSCSPELYARWIQLGAFYPFCRTHSAILTRRQEPWSFGTEVENIAREYLKLRYRFHPTLYSLFKEAAETGAPVLRPLFFEFPSDQGSYEIDDEVMFGPDVLLAPVVEKGARRRDVYLPPGGWVDFWTGETKTGPAMLGREAPLGLMPIYVRQGAVLFMWPAQSHLSGPPPDRMFIDLYPPLPNGAASERVLYEDDGETEKYLNGEFSLRRVSQQRAASGLSINVAAKQGPFSPPPRKLIFRVHLAEQPSSFSLDGKSSSLPAFSEASGTLRFDIDDDGGEHHARIDW